MTAQAKAKPLQASPTAGRPSTYTPATGELIAARLCDGELLTNICKTPGMPSRQCVHRWRMKNPAFDDLYLRARAVGMESMSDDTVLIADDDTLDVQADGSPNPTSVNRARLQVHARHFLMGKLARHVYGERQTVEHTGAVAHVVDISDRERMRRLASFIDEDQRAGHTIEGQATSLPALPDLALPDSSDAMATLPNDEPRVSDDNV